MAYDRLRGVLTNGYSTLQEYSRLQPARLNSNTLPHSARNYLIFPIQMDDSTSQSSAQSFSSYSTADMKERLMRQPDLADHTRTIWIEVATFYKQTESPQHEFIIFSVRDQTNPHLRNYIALDRNVRGPRKGLIGLMPWNRQSKDKDSTLAEDRFHVSHHGDLPPLLRHCAWNVHSCKPIEHLYFGQGLLGLDQLVVLASTTTRFRPQYTMNQYHCYWFANTMWECIIKIAGKALTEGSLSRPKPSTKRWKFKGIKILSSQHRSHLDDIMLDYKEKLGEFSSALEGSQMVSILFSQQEQI